MNTYSTGEMAKKLGVSLRTLQRWDNEGLLNAYRTPTNRRYYTEEQLNKYFGNEVSDDKRKIVAYARVSNRNQQDDLDNQIELIKRYTDRNGKVVDEYITDIGSGLNYKRKKWNKLLDDVMDNKVQKIYITYKDRFIRFGYDWFERLCIKFDTEIIVLNNRDISLTEELVDDLVSIIDVFSCRVGGLKRYKREVKEDDNLQNV